MMETSRQWQLAEKGARQYEAVLVPYILGPAAGALVRFAAPAGCTRILDAGCGTGAAARFAAEECGGRGAVLGVDVNPGMIAVARQEDPHNRVEWHQANLGQLPFESQAFDLILCAQVLQFLPEKVGALNEMRRVLGPSGRFCVSLWAPLAQSPYFRALVEAMARHIGPETASGLASAFALSEQGEIEKLLEEGGFA
ncbi:MAG: class I SAM-dependent methyltransferase, partial [Calditrichaeota bacterium]|nr:class I SAM-dependent methyltransferase [Calditrichota bacterium]